MTAWLVCAIDSSRSVASRDEGGAATVEADVLRRTNGHFRLDRELLVLSDGPPRYNDAECLRLQGLQGSLTSDWLLVCLRRGGGDGEAEGGGGEGEAEGGGGDGEAEGGGGEGEVEGGGGDGEADDGGGESEAD
mgnify:CR=1 FL=1